MVAFILSLVLVLPLILILVLVVLATHKVGGCGAFDFKLAKGFSLMYSLSLLPFLQLRQDVRIVFSSSLRSGTPYASRRYATGMNLSDDGAEETLPLTCIFSSFMFGLCAGCLEDAVMKSRSRSVDRWGHLVCLIHGVVSLSSALEYFGLLRCMYRA